MGAARSDRGGVSNARFPGRLEARRKQEVAYRLFIAGASYAQIADSDDPRNPGVKLYNDRSAARKAVQAAIERHTSYDESEQMRKTEGLRLDALMRAHWAAAMKGQRLDTDRVLAIIEARCRLFGLNKPERKQVEVITRDTVQAAIDELTREIAAAEALDGALDGDDPRAAFDSDGMPL